MDISKNSRITFHWKVSPYDYSKDKVNAILSKASKKYSIPKEHIRVIPDFVLLDDKGSEISINKDIIRRILNKVIIHNDTVEIYFSKRSVFKLCANEDKFFENDNITVKYNAKITQCSLKGGTIIIGKENNYNQVLVDAVVKGFYYNKFLLLNILLNDYACTLNHSPVRLSEAQRT